MQNQYSIPIYFEQLLSVVKQFSIEEKLTLFELLEKETASIRLARMIDAIANRNINDYVMSDKEIIPEVNEVRQQRYEQDKGSY